MSFVEPIGGIFSNDSIKCTSVNATAECFCFLFQHEAFKHLTEYHKEKNESSSPQIITVYNLRVMLFL